MNSDDYDAHIQKQYHKGKVTELKLPRGNTDENVPKANNSNDMSCSVENGHNTEPQPFSFDDSLNNKCVNADDSKVDGKEIASNWIVSVKLENVIKADHISREIMSEMIDLTSRTEDRLQSEAQVLKSLGCYIKKIDTKLSLLPFGSATYGFGGANTNLNILINTGSRT